MIKTLPLGFTTYNRVFKKFKLISTEIPAKKPALEFTLDQNDTKTNFYHHNHQSTLTKSNLLSIKLQVNNDLTKKKLFTGTAQLLGLKEIKLNLIITLLKLYLAVCVLQI